MTKLKHCLLILFIVTGPVQAVTQNLLVFSKTNGFRHESIAAGKEALDSLAASNDFSIYFTEDSLAFTRNNLSKYDALIFLSPSGDVFNEEQQDALQHYIRSGGGFVGIHGASTVEYDWPWYGKLVGSYFADHPKVQEAELHVLASHLATEHLPDPWIRSDEWYNFRSALDDSIQVLLTVDEQTYTGGKMGNHHPIAWYHEFDGGRAFYTALGHTKASYREPHFLNHILGGIKWVCSKD
ncbi:ThuA domain-containing protein [Marinoscillum furvescens]|uniref:ThuA-like domain-containing protein n=1 Tax=Marinoscillum furvescens DSM 4134 TaxID=1122208 RepID=A0A3D9L337_MARFU|nr:ThuA domain-containing protein [Marinoscillum furvescens]RED97401.1 hypothetical protein C7460_11210 [Marinoscillum furvescens DSM 4134]